MNIKILGTGCAKCKKLYSETEKALAASGQQGTLEKVEKIRRDHEVRRDGDAGIGRRRRGKVIGTYSVTSRARRLPSCRTLQGLTIERRSSSWVTACVA
ncbi:MAG: thioredoxin family protein [Polyangiaceae bacterium]